MAERDAGGVGHVLTLTQLMRFNNHLFYTRGKNIRSFRDLKIKATVGTEDVEDAGDRYVRKKNNGSIEVNFTAIFSSLVENDVKYESLNLIKAAQEGETGYLYFADGGQVWPFALMITEAEMNECSIGAGGVWTFATVRVTMKQCELNAGGVTPEETPGEGDNNQNNGKTPKKISGKLIGIVDEGKERTEETSTYDITKPTTDDIIKSWTTPAKDAVNKPNTSTTNTTGKIQPLNRWKNNKNR